MGSYERGTRAISLARTIEIANLFGIPVNELIAESDPPTHLPKIELVFDLRKISKAREKGGDLDIHSLDRYLNAVAIRRRDWNGEVLSLRKSDLDTLTLLIGRAGDDLLRNWVAAKLLLKAPNHL